MDPFADNLAALAERSPIVARLVRECPGDGGYGASQAADGAPIVERGGQPLESRRAPAQAAARQAAAVADDHVVVLGLGAGYLVEALLDAGRRVGAVVDSSPAAIAAAMRVRDLRQVLRRVPVILADVLSDPVELICLKARVPGIVPHGAAVSADPRLLALAQAWPRVPVPSRRPRVLVVGPILGGSLETARSTAAAAEAIGADVKFMDCASFDGGWQALTAMEIPAARRERLQGVYATAIGEAVLEQAAAWSPDLVLALAQAPLGATALGQLRKAGIRTAFWFVENGRVLPYWQRTAPAYDVFFAIQPGAFLEQLRAAGSPKAVYLPTACDHTRHRPVQLTAEERARFGGEVSFAGAPYLNRQRLLFVLREFDLRLWGDGWEKTELLKHAAGNGARFTLDEMVRIFAASKVNLNIHSAAHVDGLDPEPDYVNPRTFELAACGAFQLVDHRTPLPELFADDEMVTFGTVAEMRDKVGYYLERADERQAIAARSRTRALAEHTFEHRVRRILKESLPPVLVAGALRGDRQETLDEAIGRAEQAPAMTAEEAMLRALREVRPRP